MAKTSPSLHAIDYLAQSEKHPPQAVCVAFGDELFLRRQVLLKMREAVLGGEEGDFSLTTFEGATAQFRDVAEELTTVAMFGGKRLVVVEGADEFVTRYREALEDYVAAPSRGGVLLLDVKAWPSNTRLYKAIAASVWRSIATRRPAPGWPAGCATGPSRPTRSRSPSPWRTCSSR
jgi:DNA polymerase-3 subunit delta